MDRRPVTAPPVQERLDGYTGADSSAVPKVRAEHTSEALLRTGPPQTSKMARASALRPLRRRQRALLRRGPPSQRRAREGGDGARAHGACRVLDKSGVDFGPRSCAVRPTPPARGDAVCARRRPAGSPRRGTAAAGALMAGRHRRAVSFDSRPNCSATHSAHFPHDAGPSTPIHQRRPPFPVTCLPPTGRPAPGPLVLQLLPGTPLNEPAPAAPRVRRQRLAS